MVIYFATHRPSCTVLTWLFPFFFNIAAGSKLCSSGIFYGDEEDAVDRIIGRDQAMPKSEQRQIMRPKVEEKAAQQMGLC